MNFYKIFDSVDLIFINHRKYFYLNDDMCYIPAYSFTYITSFTYTKKRYRGARIIDRGNQLRKDSELELLDMT